MSNGTLHEDQYFFGNISLISS